MAVKLWRVDYVLANGKPETRWIEASNENAAMDMAGVERRYIKAVKHDWYKQLERALPASKTDISVQARVLAIFSAKVSSGSNPTNTFDKTVASIPVLKERLADVQKVQKVSEKLAVLNFDPQLVLLAEVGEASGLIGEVLGGAADEIIERNKILSAIKTKTIPSMMVAVFGLLVMLVLPIFMTEPIEQVMNSRGVVLKINWCTHVLLFLGNLMDTWKAWIILIAGCLGLGFSAPYWWQYVRNTPGLSFIESFFRIQNAYKFVSAFLPLFSRGVQVNQSIAMLKKFATGTTKKVYNQMEIHLVNGGGLSDAFEDPYWDPMLRDLMKGFDEMRQDSKLDLLRRMQPLMSQSMEKVGNQLGSVFGLGGLLLSVGITMIVFMGLTLPLMTISTAIGK